MRFANASALKRANIGVVVGSATDVAKETADLILLDSNFRTVVAHVLSNSFAEVLTIFTAVILRWPAPLAVAQILWIHLICDGPADIVLGFEPKENGIRDERPKSLREPILSRLGLSLVWAALGGLSLVALPFVVPALRTALGIVPLNLMQWLLIAGVGLMLLLAVEIGKAITNRRHARRASAP